MSKIKVNEIENRTGSTLTLGKSGTTIQMACGATQTGFGRTGTVDWCTTAKTAPFTSVSGNGYFINTSGGAVTVTLPSSPSAGDIVSIKDYADTFDTNAVTVGRGGSKIGGLCLDATLNTEGDSITLVYVDGTKGWLNIQTDDTVQANLFVAATGGTITTCGDFKVHTFTSSGCFQVTSAGQPSGSTKVDYLVVAGGGAGGRDAGAGGGAGGLRIGAITVPGPSSPLVAPGGLPVSVQTYPITVGAGGATNSSPGCVAGSGVNSIFSTITSAGGGGAGGQGNGSVNGSPGGSGGGASPGTAGSGNTPPVSPPQGNNGGSKTGGTASGGGGGGATAVGSNATSCQGAAGGNGLDVSPIFGSAPQPFYQTDVPTAGPTANGTFAGGGGGGPRGPAYAPGYTAQGGDGGGGDGRGTGTESGYEGVVNSGGGGGGGPAGASPSTAGAGGSGIVIIRYKFQ